VVRLPKLTFFNKWWKPSGTITGEIWRSPQILRFT